MAEEEQEKQENLKILNLKSRHNSNISIMKNKNANMKILLLFVVVILMSTNAKAQNPIDKPKTPASNLENFTGTLEYVIPGIAEPDKCRIGIKEYPNVSFYLSLEDAIKYGLIIKRDNILNTSAIKGKKVLIDVEDSWVKSVEVFDNQQLVKNKIQETQVTPIEKNIDQIRADNFKKLDFDMSPEEVISLLKFEKEINRNFNGGIFIGIGLFPSDSNNISSYTGIVELQEYLLIFTKGVLKLWSIDSAKIGTQEFKGEYTYKGILSSTKNTWTLRNGVFNITTKLIPPTPEERAEKKLNAIKYYEEDVEKGKTKIDTLVKQGYKVINKNGFDSFIVDTTSFMEITGKLGMDYILEEFKGDFRKGMKGIFYPKLGAAFYFKKIKNSEKVILIRLLSPFKGILIFDNRDSYMHEVMLIEPDKTTKGDLDRGISYTWRSYDRGNSYSAAFSPKIELIIKLEKRLSDVGKNDKITEIQIY